MNNNTRRCIRRNRNNNTRGVGRKSLLLMLMAVLLYLSLLAWLGKGRLQGRLNIQSNAAALRAFMRQRWYIQAHIVCLFVEFGKLYV